MAYGTSEWRRAEHDCTSHVHSDEIMPHWTTLHTHGPEILQEHTKTLKHSPKTMLFGPTVYFTFSPRRDVKLPGLLLVDTELMIKARQPTTHLHHTASNAMVFLPLHRDDGGRRWWLAVKSREACTSPTLMAQWWNDSLPRTAMTNE